MRKKSRKAPERFGVRSEVRAGECSWRWAESDMRVLEDIGSGSAEGIGVEVVTRVACSVRLAICTAGGALRAGVLGGTDLRGGAACGSGDQHGVSALAVLVCRSHRKTGPFWRCGTDQCVGYAPACSRAEKWAGSLLLRHFLCGFGLRGLLSQPGAVGFARDLQNDCSLDQSIQEGHGQRTVG